MATIQVFFQKPAEDLKPPVSRDRLIREAGGVYSTILNSDDAKDRERFRRWFREDSIQLNGFRPKDLVSFDAAFATPEAKTMLKQLGEFASQLPDLQNEKADSLAEVELVRTAMNENSDPAQVEPLFKRLHAKQRQAELARLQADACIAGIKKTKAQLIEALDKFRKNQFEALRQPVDEAAERFNAEIMAAFERFWAVAKDALPQVAEASPNPFPASIHYNTPEFAFNEASRLKQLRLAPQIKINRNAYLFDLQEVSK